MPPQPPRFNRVLNRFSPNLHRLNHSVKSRLTGVYNQAYSQPPQNSDLHCVSSAQTIADNTTNAMNFIQQTFPGARLIEQRQVLYFFPSSHFQLYF